MIIGIFGRLGTGKTLLATILAYKYYCRGWKIYANYRLPFARPIQSVGALERLKNAVLVFDEFYLDLEARRSMSLKNLFILKCFMCARKKNVHLIYTAQYPRSVDRRLRCITDLFMFPQHVEKNGRATLLVEVVLPRGSAYTVKISNVHLFYQLYDTNEIVEPLPMKATRTLDMFLNA